MTGLADRAHLFGPEIDLETHIADVLGLLEWEDLHDVVLVGHSYGGMVITAVADRAPERIARLVYLDALWPEAGETVADLVGADAAAVVAAAEIDPERPPTIRGAEAVAEMLGVTRSSDVAWVAPRLTPQPPGTLVQPIELTGAGADVPVLFVACGTTQFEGPDRSRDRARARAEVDPTAEVVVVDAPHNAMVTHPDLVVALLSQSSS